MNPQLKAKLDCFNLPYREQENKIRIRLGLALLVEVEQKEDKSYKIESKLTAWNFLTGGTEMRLRNAIIYSCVGLVLAAVVLKWYEVKVYDIDATLIVLVLSVLTIIFVCYYAVKAEAFKMQVLRWLSPEV